jgi:hypothetical protein
VQIARRIEEGQQRMVAEALACPVGLRHLVQVAERLAAGEMSVRDVMRDTDDDREMPEEEEAVLRDTLLRRIADVVQKAVEIASPAGARMRRGKNEHGPDQGLCEQRSRLLVSVRALRLNHRQIEAAINQMRETLVVLDEIAAPITRYEASFERRVTEILRLCHSVMQGRDESKRESRTLRVNRTQAAAIDADIRAAARRLRAAERRVGVTR